MKVSISSTTNGFVVQIADTIKVNGTYVFRGIDIIAMLEFVGRAILDRPVEVKEK